MRPEFQIDVRENEPLAPLTTFKVGGPAAAAVDDQLLGPLGHLTVRQALSNQAGRLQLLRCQVLRRGYVTLAGGLAGLGVAACGSDKKADDTAATTAARSARRTTPPGRSRADSPARRRAERPAGGGGHRLGRGRGPEDPQALDGRPLGERELQQVVQTGNLLRLQVMAPDGRLIAEAERSLDQREKLELERQLKPVIDEKGGALMSTDGSGFAAADAPQCSSLSTDSMPDATACPTAATGGPARPAGGSCLLPMFTLLGTWLSWLIPLSASLTGLKLSR